MAIFELLDYIVNEASTATPRYLRRVNVCKRHCVIVLSQFLATAKAPWDFRP